MVEMKRKYSAQFVSTYTKAKSLSPHAFEKHYVSALKDPNTIHFQLKIGNYPCFYHQDSCQNLLVNDLMAKNAELNAILSSFSPLEMAWAREDGLVKEVLSSLRIDGISASEKEVFEAIHIFHGGMGEAGSLSSAYLLIDDGMDFPLKELEDIRHLYDFLMRISLNKVERPDTALFRMKPHEENDDRLAFIADPAEIKYALKEALSILGIDSLNPFVRLALFDFFFQYAHPFNAGNNRTLRYIDSFYIHKSISPYFAFYLSQCEEASLSGLVKSYRLTLSSRNRSDLTTFCNAFLDILSHAYDDRIYALRREKQKVYDLKRTYDGKIEEPLLGYLIDWTIFLPYGASAYDLAALNEVSSRTILRSLALAKGKGYIVEKAVGKTIHYSLKGQ